MHPLHRQGCRADALGHCLGEQLEGVWVSMGAPWKRPGGFTDLTDLLQVSQSCLHSEGVPKHIPLPQTESWGGGQERFGGY